MQHLHLCSSAFLRKCLAVVVATAAGKEAPFHRTAASGGGRPRWEDRPAPHAGTEPLTAPPGFTPQGNAGSHQTPVHTPPATPTQAWNQPKSKDSVNQDHGIKPP